MKVCGILLSFLFLQASSPARSNIIKNNYCYVDKTPLIAKLVNHGGVLFPVPPPAFRKKPAYLHQGAHLKF